MPRIQDATGPHGGSKDDFLEKVQRLIRDGDRAEVEKLLREFPHEGSRPVSPGEPSGVDSTEGLPPGRPLSTEAVAPVPSSLGDFQLVREIGRGGMGVVYEACQRSLNKTVALKILPVAGVLDDRSLQRFQNEARAAAQLQHPNIVPVHAVGCDRGVHYYAMQFIEGINFARLIAGLRDVQRNQRERETSRIAPATTAPRTAASSSGGDQSASDLGASDLGASESSASEDSASRDFVAALTSRHTTASREYLRPLVQCAIQIASALHYAHSMGIVHRDIKPANLLLDSQGNTWLTDFGLAQVQGNPGMTVTGNIVGTLRYMSPEQAYANRVIVDHRTDIYSLGVTLYELLVLRPAVTGTGRAEVLRRLAFEDPPSPRRLDRRIPAELETIVMKSISKSPDDRYQTAQELAEDLSRFQRDEPIRARPPTLAQRAAKWSRKHKKAVATSGLVAAFLFLATAMTAVLVFGAYQQALDNLQQSEGLRLVANSTLQLENDPALALALAVRGAELYQGLEANNALVESLGAIHEARTLSSHVEPVGSVDFSSNGSLVLSTGHTSHFSKPSVQAAQIWEVSTGKLIRSLESELTVTSAVFSPSDGRVLAAFSPSPPLSRDDREEGQYAGRPPMLWAWETDRRRVLDGAYLLSADRRAFTPDGRLVVTPAFGNEAVIWDVVDGGEYRRLKGHTKRVVSAIFSPDGKRVATTSDDNTVRLWNINDDEELILDSWQQNSPVASTSVVSGIAFSPDGSRLVTAARQAGIQIWNCETGERIFGQFLAGSRGQFTRDGQRLVTIRHAHVDVYDAKTFKRLYQLEGNNGTIKNFAVSPHGKLVTVWSFGATARVWSLESGKLDFELRGHSAEITSASFDRTGKRIVSGSMDQTARIWNVESGASLRRLDKKVNRELGPLVSFSPNSQRLVAATEPSALTHVHEINELSNPRAVSGHLFLPQQLGSQFLQASYGKVSLIDAASGREIASVPIKSGSAPAQAVLSPSGFKAVIIANGKVNIWDIEASALVPVDSSATAFMAEFNASGALFAVRSDDGAARIYVTETNELLHELNRGERLQFMRFGPSDERFLTVSSNNRLVLWDLADGKELAELANPGARITHAAFNFDGSRLLAYSEGGCERVVCWDLQSNRPVCDLSFETRAVIKLDTHPSENKVALATDVGGVILWDTATDETTRLTTDAASAVTFAPDGRIIAALAKQPAPAGPVPTMLADNYASPSFRMWEPVGGSPVEEFRTLDSFTDRLAVSKQGDLLYAKSHSYGASIFETATTRELRTISMHGAPLTFLRFTPSGKHIVSASWDRTAAIWNAESGAALHRLVGHTAAILAAALSPDGSKFATADVTGAVRIWNTRTGRLLREFSDHTDAVLFAQFSVDSERLLTGSLDQTVRISSVSGDSVIVVKSSTEIPRWARFAPSGNSLLVIPSGPLETRIAGMPPRFARLAQNYIKVYKQLGASPFELPQAEQVLDATLVGRGERVFVVAFQNGVEEWDVGAQNMINRFAEDRAVRSVVPFSNSRVLTISPTEFSTWDAENGLELMRVESRLSYPSSSRLESCSPDGQWLATVTRSGIVERWPTDPLDSARRRMPRRLTAPEVHRFRVPSVGR